MKKICLLRKAEFFWGQIEIFLRSINAEILSFGSTAEAERIRQADPDLVIAGGATSDLEPLLELRIPIMLISAQPASLPARYAGIRRLTVLSWPVTKREFLERTASILLLAPRRQFRAVIRVSRSGDDTANMAQSVDFSTTGMSFSSSHHYVVGTRLTVSVSLPGMNHSVHFPGTIVRCFEDDEGRPHCGVEFRDLTPEAREALEDFILT